MLKQLMQEVLDLQPSWSHKKTHAMDRRGIIVRREIPQLIREHLERISAGSVVSDLDWAVEGRDGTGPKTEIPWVRVYDRAMSPSATIGWYAVYLFSAHGDHLYLSLAHGSTEWTGIDFRPRPVAELHEMTKWARKIVTESKHLSTDFVPEIALDARRSNLGAAYEAGTVLAKQYASAALPSDDAMWSDLTHCLTSLSVLYEHEEKDPLMPGIDPPEIRALATEIEEAAGRITHAKSSRGSNGQGFGLSRQQRDAVEQHAVRIARNHYEGQGWKVKDVGATHSYDLHCLRDDEVMIVEVKGTTSRGRSIILTANEVRIHEEKYPKTALFVVSQISLGGSKEEPTVSGGVAREVHPWLPSSSDLVPMAFKYAVPDAGISSDARSAD